MRFLRILTKRAMDIAACLQHFESRISSYAGDDPLDLWDKFVEYMEKMLPADGAKGMSLVFNRIVEKFLDVERYANDVRYLDYCIKCASSYQDPIALFSHIFNKGVGTRTAALYVAWAQQFEQKGMNEQADTVYQKALENQAQPADAVLHHYRQFQARTRSQNQTVSGGQTPLQNSNLTNQMTAQTGPAPPTKTSVDCPPKPAAYKTVITVSRSETSGTIPSSTGVPTVTAYDKDSLECEGSELCFEEVRAQRYFHKLKEKQEEELRRMKEEILRKEEAYILDMKSRLEKLNRELEASGGFPIHQTSDQPSVTETATGVNPNPTHQALGRPPSWSRPSSRRSLGLRLHTDPAFIQEAAVTSDPPQQSNGTPNTTSMVQPLKMNQGPAHSANEDNAISHHVDPVQTSGSEHEPGRPLLPKDKLNTSQGGVANLSHVTPNTSLGFVQATPSRALPSPTVNTREALDVIMDMFQAPTLLEETFSNTSTLHAGGKDPDPGLSRTGVSSLPKAPPTSAPFTIFQDSDDKENCRLAPPAGEEVKPVQALAEIPASKPGRPNETSPDLMPNDSTMWGARYNSLNSLAACPNSTSDFAMLAQFVSTPFTHKNHLNSNFFQDQEICDGADRDEEAFVRRRTKKLSPIIEQSPTEDKLSGAAVSQQLPSSSTHGTIVGEGLALPTTCLASSSITMIQPPPPAVLSFRDHTLCPTDASIQRTAGPSWEVYTSPGPDPQSSAKPRGAEPFTIMEDLDRPGSPQVHGPAEDVPMSPESAPRLDWLSIRSPEHAAEPDLDAFLSPCPPRTPQTATAGRTGDVPMSLQLYADVPMSPAPQPPSDPVDQPMMSPDRGAGPCADVSMIPKTPRTARLESAPLVSDPWDNELISGLLSALNPPLTSHPHCISWQGNIPNICPRTTISMGKASLRVDGVLGEGAFATVYQATDPVTSERMVLKVQKPANPWEFYINTQLDVRVQPNVRHLYSRLSSAHLFHDGSVLLGELHSYGTLLNAVNLYKSRSEKVMPAALVLYFSTCILHMVEQLHAVGIVHADIKPDNFLLGERFLENKCFEPDHVDHGLVLVDLGQSIDLQLFPPGTAFTAACQTSGFQCAEMQSGKPWNYQTDYFGVAGTVYCLLFGTYMQVTREDGVWRTNGIFRRNPHSDLWLDFFHTLLNVPDCRTLPDLTGLRRRLTSVLLQNYGSKLSTLKSRLVVLLLENRKAPRR